MAIHGSTTEVSAVAGDLRVVVGQLVRRLREQSEGSDLTKSQSAVLGRLERDGPATASVLARAEGIRPQSMGSIIAGLQAAGLVVGAPDPSDGRKTLLRITETARDQFRTGRLAREDWFAKAMAATLSPAELDQLSAAVHLLRRLAQS